MKHTKTLGKVIVVTQVFGFLTLGLWIALGATVHPAFFIVSIVAFCLLIQFPLSIWHREPKGKPIDWNFAARFERDYPNFKPSEKPLAHDHNWMY